jgi:hypothetical protein
MDLVINPEPGPEQRDALERALAKLFPEDTAGTASVSAWWKEGVAENLDGGAFDEGVD